MRKLFLLFSSVLLLAGWASSQQVTVTCGTSVCIPAGSIVVSANPTSILIGGTSILKAVAYDINGTANNDSTGLCTWFSSNPAVLAVSNGIATGISNGSATANCSIGGITGTTPFTIGVSSMVITTPTCGTPPCVLPPGTNTVAYGPFTFAASGGTLPYTWSLSAGSFAGCGVSLSAAGVLSGTASTGICTPTVQVTDSASHSASVAVQLTVNASGCTPGPPNYGCTLSVVQQGGAFAPTVVPFSGQSSACSPGPYPACSGVDNTLVSDPEPVGSGNTSGLYHNPIVRITNAASLCGANSSEPACPSHQNYAAEVDQGGSGDIQHWNTDSTLFYVGFTGGAQNSFFYSFNPSTMQATFKYSSGSAFAMPKQPNFSPTLNHIVYGLANSGQTGDGTILTSWDVSVNFPTLPSPTQVYNFATSVNCLPAGFTVSTDPPNVGVVAGSDKMFVEAFSTSSTQNTGRDVAGYKVGSGCSNLNTSTGKVTGDWGGTGNAVCPNCVVTAAPTSVVASSLGGGNFLYLANVASNLAFRVGDSVTLAGATAFNGTYTISALAPGQVQWTTVGGSAGTATGGTLTDNTPSPGTFTIHNVKASKDGAYAIITVTACDTATSVCYEGQNPYLWQVGTVNVYTQCPASCGGHYTEGYSTVVNQYNTPFYGQRTFASPLTPSAFPPAWCASYTQTFDTHPGWGNADLADDTAFLTTTTSYAALPDYSKCAVNEVLGFYVNGANAGTSKRFGHTYNVPTPCFATAISVGSVSQDGRFFLFTSDMNATLGCTNGSTSCTVTTSGSCGTSNNAPRGDAFVMKLQ